jgi:phosphatidylserine/phosphatidylglycerophosphate/cardiolipin synthase-like enzyme
MSRSVRKAGLARLGALLITGLLMAGCIPAFDIPTLDTSVPTATVPMPGGIGSPAPGGSTDGSTDGSDSGENVVWAVYFTDPVIPFDDVTTGGLDDNLVYLIDNAQSSIDIAMFEFDLQSVADALIRAHQRGVSVRVVYDDEYAEEDPQLGQVLAAGIPGTPDDREDLMHDKFAVFDDEIVWTGSLNFTENGVYRNNNNVMAFISPELAANYSAEFEEMFSGEFGPGSPANTPYPGTAVGDLWVETYFSPEDDPIDMLVDLVSGAQESIHFMAFSYTQDNLADAMVERANAGVEVAGLFEARGANTQYSECPRLLNLGLDVRLDGNPRVMHHKVIIIDGQIVATGSFNFSANASERNDENVIIVHSLEVANYYEAEFYRRIAEGVPPVGGECLAGDE